MYVMANWQASTPRQAPKTKAELRLMLTEAVQNTQASTERRPKRTPEVKVDQS